MLNQRSKKILMIRLARSRMRQPNKRTCLSEISIRSIRNFCFRRKISWMTYYSKIKRLVNSLKLRSQNCRRIKLEKKPKLNKCKKKETSILPKMKIFNAKLISMRHNCRHTNVINSKNKNKLEKSVMISPAKCSLNFRI